MSSTITESTVEEIEYNINSKLASMISRSHSPKEEFEALHWMNQWMRGLFKSCSLGHTIRHLRKNSCYFKFDSITKQKGTLSLTADPSFGMLDIELTTGDECIEFINLHDALDFWEGNVTLAEIDSDDYSYHKITEEERNQMDEDERVDYEYERRKYDN